MQKSAKSHMCIRKKNSKKNIIKIVKKIDNSLLMKKKLKYILK